VSGICGTDRLGYGGHYDVHHVPLTLGHEFVADVAEIGDDVTAVAVGDRAVATPSWPCGTCANFAAKRARSQRRSDLHRLRHHGRGDGTRRTSHGAAHHGRRRSAADPCRNT
jgi:threonine dehydrogenase-like Zn-dependent dehydrogenase